MNVVSDQTHFILHSWKQTVPGHPEDNQVTAQSKHWGIYLKMIAISCAIRENFQRPKDKPQVIMNPDIIR